MQFNSREALTILFKYRRRVLGTFVVFIAASGLAAVLTTPLYHAQSDVLVKLGRELVFRPDTGSTAASPPVIDKDEVLSSNIEILTSRDVLSRTIRDIGVERLYPELLDARLIEPLPRRVLVLSLRAVKAVIRQVLPTSAPATNDPLFEDALASFTRDLQVEAIKKTSVIAVSFLHRDPQIAAETVNHLVAAFKARTVAIYNESNVDFSERAVEADRNDLAKADHALDQFRRDYRLYALPEQISLLLKQKIEINSTLKGLDSHVAELARRVVALNAQLKTMPATVPLFSENDRFRVIDDTQAQLLTLRNREKELSAIAAGNYPPLDAVRRQIKQTEAFLAEQTEKLPTRVRTGPNDLYRELDLQRRQAEAELASIVARRDMTAAQFHRIDATVGDLSARDVELKSLERDALIAEQRLKDSQGKLEDARALDNLNREKSASFNVIQEAVAPDPRFPARPQPMLYLFLASVVGALAASEIGVLSYRMNDAYVTPEQVSVDLGVPVLGVVAMRSV